MFSNVFHAHTHKHTRCHLPREFGLDILLRNHVLTRRLLPSLRVSCPAYRLSPLSFSPGQVEDLKQEVVVEELASYAVYRAQMPELPPVNGKYLHKLGRELEASQSQVSLPPSLGWYKKALQPKGKSLETGHGEEEAMSSGGATNTEGPTKSITIREDKPAAAAAAAPLPLENGGGEEEEGLEGQGSETSPRSKKKRPDPREEARKAQAKLEEEAWAMATRLPSGFGENKSKWLTSEPEWAKQRRVYLAEQSLPNAKRRVEAPKRAHREEREAIRHGEFDGHQSLAYAMHHQVQSEGPQHQKATHHGTRDPKLKKGRSTLHEAFDAKMYEHPEVSSVF